jgi:hypothetical protein
MATLDNFLNIVPIVSLVIVGAYYARARKQIALPLFRRWLTPSVYRFTRKVITSCDKVIINVLVKLYLLENLH